MEDGGRPRGPAGPLSAGCTSSQVIHRAARKQREGEDSRPDQSPSQSHHYQTHTVPPDLPSPPRKAVQAWRPGHEPTTPLARQSGLCVLNGSVEAQLRPELGWILHWDLWRRTGEEDISSPRSRETSLQAESAHAGSTWSHSHTPTHTHTDTLPLFWMKRSNEADRKHESCC